MTFYYVCVFAVSAGILYAWNLTVCVYVQRVCLCAIYMHKVASLQQCVMVCIR